MNGRLLALGVATATVSLFVFTDSLPHFSNPYAQKQDATTLQSGAAVVPYKTPDSATYSSGNSHNPPVSTAEETTRASSEAPVFQHASSTYIETVDGCGPYFGGACVVVRSGPSATSSKVAKLRDGVVLKTSGYVESEGRRWYKIAFDEWVRYPERLSSEWYVAGDIVRVFPSADEEALPKGATTTTAKHIEIDRGEQTLYAYDGDTLFMKQKISTGLDLTPTPRGTFAIYRKTPTRYMQGPLPGISNQYYDLPGVPWNLYFTEEGGALHGAYWHDHFGEQWSHGCVNLPPDKAKELYDWAELGTPVTVHD